MEQPKNKNDKGFSLIELVISMIIILILLGVVSSLISAALGTRTRESQRTDALTAARAALNIISREVSNSGFGIKNSATQLASNGIILVDSNEQKLHFNSNIINTNPQLCDKGEDITYFYDATIKSIVRYERYSSASPPDCSNLTTQSSIIINRISSVNFTYYDYSGSSSATTPRTTPTADTGRITITVTVKMESVQGQPSNEIAFTSDVTLRNANYMLNQY